MGGGSKPKAPTIAADNLYSQDIVELGFGIVTGKQIGRASCRERVSSPV